MQAFCQLCTISRRQKTELDGIQQSRAQDTIKRCLIVRQRNTIPCFCICCKSYRCKIVAGAYCVLFISLDFRLLFHHRRFCAVIKRICWYNFTIRTFYSHPTYQACFSYFRRTIRSTHKASIAVRSRDNEWLFIMFAWAGAAVGATVFLNNNKSLHSFSARHDVECVYDTHYVTPKCLCKCERATEVKWFIRASKTFLSKYCRLKFVVSKTLRQDESKLV